MSNMTTANGTKPKTKRPLTIYDCSPDQKNDCDYKYLARVWFFRTLVIVVVSGVGVAGSILWKTATWKKDTEYQITTLKSESESYDLRIKNIERTIKSDLDSLKAWNRPK